MLVAMQGAVDNAFDLVDARLGEAQYLAGNELHRRRHHDGLLADHDALLPCPMISALAECGQLSQRIGARPAYQRAMEKGDPGMALLLS